MRNVKWQAIIPALIIAVMGFFILRPSSSTSENKAKNAQTTNSNTAGIAHKQQADNDEHIRFDPTIMPQKMMDKVAELYPELNANNIHWVQPKYGWEAQFEADGQEIEVEFDKSGNWIETELENVPRTMIPQRVLAAVLSRFPSCQFKEYEIEYTADGTFYEIEIMDGEQEREIYYNDKGEKKTNTNED
jgi:hypothetical protein